MSKTDFFELPEGDQHRECIEVETDYDRGVMDERKRWEAKRCETCKSKYVVSYDCIECRHNDSPIDYIDLDCFPDFGCIFHEPKGSE